MSIGHAVVVDTGRVEVVLVSKHVEPYGIDLLTTVGIDPRRRKFVALKSRHHWRTDLGELAAAVVNCAGQGVCTSDYDALEFHRLRRPIYPIDPRSEERRVGKECVSTCRSRWSPYPYKKKHKNKITKKNST